jgi:hypothetical protein
MKKKKKSDPSPQYKSLSSVSLPSETSSPLSTSCRLPDHLSTKAKECAAFYGISLNALICVAIGDFLREKGFD